MDKVFFGRKPKTHTYEEFVADVERRRAELAAESKETSEKEQLSNMRTIRIADDVYADIMSRRIGDESITEILERELRPIDSRHHDVKKWKEEPRRKLTEI